jgi:hypothetical protein
MTTVAKVRANGPTEIRTRDIHVVAAALAVVAVAYHELPR